MKPFNQCPVCRGALVEKEVKKLLKGGVNTAVLRVTVEVCLGCGERAARLLHPTPLLEEKWDLCSQALLSNIRDPFLHERS